MNVLLGFFLHALGGSSAASCYVPFKGVRAWRWESMWLICGLMAWLILPWTIVWITVPDIYSLLAGVDSAVLWRTYLFGALWGVGGLTFGMSMRYIGYSLGYTIAIGLSAGLGTLVPPLVEGRLAGVAATFAGKWLLLGVAVSLLGIAICGIAGWQREKSLQKAALQGQDAEAFNFWRGLLIACFAGIFSAAFAFGISAGRPIQDRAIQLGVHPLWVISCIFIVELAGGFTINALYSLAMNVRNRSFGDYAQPSVSGSLTRNYLLSSLAGLLWYGQFLFYGMAESQMGAYRFSSWAVHMSLMIVASNAWGIALGEWRSIPGKTYRTMLAGIVTILTATLIISYSNYVAAH